jgi:DNA-binding transcriptional LysR family regulator
MNVGKVDLNLLVYLDVLLRELNVTRAAEQLGITQPAMSNGLKRLREMFNDPLLIRSSEGMKPTERALDLQPKVRQILAETQHMLEPKQEFKAITSRRVFRIMVSDYAEATLIPTLIKHIRSEAPHIILDLLTPSDVSYQDMEQGRVDMAINRFDEIPQSFHQQLIWKDSFSCLINRNNPIVENFNLKTYLAAQHIWVSKTGMGVGFGVNPEKSGGLGWIDTALQRIGQKRKITIFTRHYQMPGLLAQNNDLVATLPSRVARMQAENPKLVILDPPFYIPPFELKMAWSPLLHPNAGHQWLRRLIVYTAERLKEELPPPPETYLPAALEDPDRQ